MRASLILCPIFHGQSRVSVNVPPIYSLQSPGSSVKALCPPVAAASPRPCLSPGNVHPSLGALSPGVPSCTARQFVHVLPVQVEVQPGKM